MPDDTPLRYPTSVAETPVAVARNPEPSVTTASDAVNAASLFTAIAAAALISAFSMLVIELPVPSASKVLLVNVSVVALPTSVSVAAGIVIVPLAAAVGTNAVVPDDEPVNVTPCVPAMTPVVSAIVMTEPCKVSPPVPSARGTPLSVVPTDPPIVPVPNAANDIAVTPSVPPLLDVQTHAVSAFVVPSVTLTMMPG